MKIKKLTFSWPCLDLGSTLRNVDSRRQIPARFFEAFGDIQRVPGFLEIKKITFFDHGLGAMYIITSWPLLTLERNSSSEQPGTENFEETGRWKKSNCLRLSPFRNVEPRSRQGQEKVNFFVFICTCFSMEIKVIALVLLIILTAQLSKSVR